jgi:hypothetical protein
MQISTEIIRERGVGGGGWGKMNSPQPLYSSKISPAQILKLYSFSISPVQILKSYHQENKKMFNCTISVPKK